MINFLKINKRGILVRSGWLEKNRKINKGGDVDLAPESKQDPQQKAGILYFFRHIHIL